MSYTLLHEQLMVKLLFSQVVISYANSPSPINIFNYFRVIHLGTITFLIMNVDYFICTIEIDIL